MEEGRTWEATRYLGKRGGALLVGGVASTTGCYGLLQSRGGSLQSAGLEVNRGLLYNH